MEVMADLPAETRQNVLIIDLPAGMRQNVLINQDRRCSAWLAALLIGHYKFAPHKGDFRHALSLQYGWPLAYASSTCSCGSTFKPDHIQTCKWGGCLSQRDNEIGDFTAKMQKETHSNMVTESRLQLNTGEHLPKTANEDDEANVDISANSF